MSSKYQLMTAASPTVTRIIPELAKEIGLNESIMLLQIAFWIENSTAEPQDGDYWTYQSVRKMHSTAFSYWSIATINRTVESLETAGYIRTGNFNKRQGDTTRWFALVPEKLRELTSISIREITVEKKSGNGDSKRNTPFQNETPISQNETTLPEITTESKKEIVTDVTASQPRSTKSKKAKAIKSRGELEERDTLYELVERELYAVPGSDSDPYDWASMCGYVVKWLRGDIEKFRTNTFGRISAPATPEQFRQFMEYIRRTSKVEAYRYPTYFVEGWRRWAGLVNSRKNTPASSSSSSAPDMRQMIGGMR